MKDTGLNQDTGGPFGTLGRPWWDQKFSNDISLMQVSQILNDVKLRKKYRILGEVFIFEIDVKLSQGDKIRKWWEEKYHSNLGIYSVNVLENGDHCTTTVKDSLVNANVIPPQRPLEICTPKSFLVHMQNFSINSAGLKSGKKASMVVLKDIS